MVHNNRKEIIYVEDPHIEEQQKDPEVVEKLLEAGQLTAVNVMSPTTLAGMQNPGSNNQQPPSIDGRKRSTEAESVQLSLNDLEILP